jgi:hypothetical protein
MDIEGLLNPAEESVIIDNATDQEIYEAVMASHNAQEDILINGGDDDTDDDGLSEPYPTYSRGYFDFKEAHRLRSWSLCTKIRCYIRPI